MAMKNIFFSAPVSNWSTRSNPKMMPAVEPIEQMMMECLKDVNVNGKNAL
jgi:hypothetical protein